MKESILRYFQVETILRMSYPIRDPMGSLIKITQDDFFDVRKYPVFFLFNRCSAQMEVKTAAKASRAKSVFHASLAFIRRTFLLRHSIRSGSSSVYTMWGL